MSDAPRYAGFGDYLRAQRQLAHLSLRQLAELTKVSNPYLSQLERGMHQPSVAVLKALADALNVSFDMLLTQGTSQFSNMPLSAVCSPVTMTARDDVHIVAEPK